MAKGFCLSFIVYRSSSIVLGCGYAALPILQAGFPLNIKMDLKPIDPTP